MEEAAGTGSKVRTREGRAASARTAVEVVCWPMCWAGLAQFPNLLYFKEGLKDVRYCCENAACGYPAVRCVTF